MHPNMQLITYRQNTQHSLMTHIRIWCLWCCVWVLSQFSSHKHIFGNRRHAEISVIILCVCDRSMSDARLMWTECIQRTGEETFSYVLIYVFVQIKIYISLPFIVDSMKKSLIFAQMICLSETTLPALFQLTSFTLFLFDFFS